VSLKSFSKNLSIAIFSQGISAAIGVVTALIVPKILGVEEFGYWQLFIFYTNYVGFFHFGLNDGVYLINGGKTRAKINKASIASQFYCGAIYQSIIALAIVLFALGDVSNPDRQFVIIATAGFLLLNNLSLYLGYVFQAMNETKLYSFSVMVDRLVFLVPLIVLLITGETDFRLYVYAYAFSKTCELIYCCYKAQDFLQLGMRDSRILSTVLKSIRVGIKLMLANVANMLIIGVARLLVDINWGIEIFGEVSFALSLVGFVLVFVQQVSMVLFPALRQIDQDRLVGVFTLVRDALGLFLPAVLLLYLPVVSLLLLWLPQYSMGLSLFVFLIPMCIYDGKMDIVGATFLKVLRGEGALLKLNAVTVVFSFVGCMISVYCFHSIKLVMISILVAVIGRSLASEWLIEKRFHIPLSMIGVVSAVLTVIFVITTLYIGGLIAWFITLVAYFIYLLLFKNTLKSCVKAFCNLK
jgi:O-antigen/teichoic acid export membrane protein